ncbi:MAG: Gfo/Idh/MocA family oxidoreductase [Propionicimonas sp.]|nr:Gfo/Idh/MocA family oxidoreductase [Propionicimonas sp.]
MLRIGIIGCGKIAEVRHAPEYHENPDCEITAYYDVDPQRSALLAGQFGGRVCDSVAELLASGVDAVSVCVANNMHAEVSVAALDAGAHVLCEKPMATTPQGCRDMLAAAERAGKRLMIGLNQRFARAHVRAKEILDSGELGQVLTFRTNFCHPGPEGWTGRADSWFFDRRVASFGVMADLGVHKTDLIHYLTGQPVVATSAVLGTLDKKLPDGSPVSVDDNAVAIYTMANGAIGTMNVSWTDYGSEDNSTRIYCTGGVLRLYDDPEYSLIVETPDRVDRYALDQLTSNKEQTTGGRTSTGVIDAFVTSILTDSPSIAEGATAVHAMDVIFANQRSSELRRSVRIGEGEELP